MNQGRGVARIVAACASIAAVFGACSGGSPSAIVVPAPAPTPAGPRSSEASSPQPSVPDGEGGVPAWAPRVHMIRDDEVRAAHWYDDEIARELASDCHWDPQGCIRAASASTYYDGDNHLAGLKEECQQYAPLSCLAIPSQACNPNPCSQEDGCFRTCRETCNDCGGECAKVCETCKAGCKDEGCRLACGRNCAICHGECMKTLDRCTTTGCAAQAKQCYRDQPKDYAATTCSKVCPSVRACVEKCPGFASAEQQMSFRWYEEGCPAKCFERLGKGCPDLWRANCVGNASRLIIMMTDEQLKEMGD